MKLIAFIVHGLCNKYTNNELSMINIFSQKKSKTHRKIREFRNVSEIEISNILKNS